jgi:hypothetical protein
VALPRPLIAVACGVSLALSGLATPGQAQSLRGTQDEVPPVKGGRTWQSARVKSAKSTQHKPVPQASIREVGDPVPPARAPVVKDIPPPEPAPQRRRKPPQPDPYDPLGLRLGGIEVFPWFEESLGYDSNPNRIPQPGHGSGVVKTELGVTAKSDWSAHEFEATIRGAYFVYPDVSSADRPDADANLRLRLDATRDLAVEFTANGSVGTQQPGTVEQPLVGTQRGLVYGGGASAALIRSVGPATATLKTTVQRFTYGDLDVAGVTIPQGFRDYDDAGLSLRLGYDVQPGFQPFVEAQVDRRTYDRTDLLAGYDADSDGLVGRVGLALDITRVVRGEASFGYGQRQADDTRLQSLRGPVFDASIVWTPTALTSVKFTAANSLGDITAATAAGSKTQSAGVEVTHALRRNLSLIGFVTAARTDYEGSNTREDGLTAGVKLDYKLNRSLVLRTSFTHERLQSSVPGKDYTANVFLVGLRLQR